MKYEQLITLYGTVITEAKNKKEAERKINNIIWNLKDRHNHLIESGLIIGDIEIESDIKKSD